MSGIAPWVVGVVGVTGGIALGSTLGRAEKLHAADHEYRLNDRRIAYRDPQAAEDNVNGSADEALAGFNGAYMGVLGGATMMAAGHMFRHPLLTAAGVGVVAFGVADAVALSHTRWHLPEGWAPDGGPEVV